MANQGFETGIFIPGALVMMAIFGFILYGQIESLMYMYDDTKRLNEVQVGFVKTSEILTLIVGGFVALGTLGLLGTRGNRGQDVITALLTLGVIGVIYYGQIVALQYWDQGPRERMQTTPTEANFAKASSFLTVILVGLSALALISQVARGKTRMADYGISLKGSVG
jgi:amino acid transporter